MKIEIEAWAPEYGGPVDSDTLLPSETEVDASVEIDVARWRPLRPACARARRVDFIDGVRRIDARVWITGDDGATRMGVCASFAAGLVRCDGTNAHILNAQVRRGLFAPGAQPELHTRAGDFPPYAVASDDIDRLSQAVQENMALLERAVAAMQYTGDGQAPGDALLVLDGPLTGKLDLAGAVGYIKSHRVAYLPTEAATVLERLAPGERSPLFVTQGKFSRFSWYVRLTSSNAHPWAALVRCEASAQLAVPHVISLADTTAATLPRFASAPHKDPRAPQNLYPIAGLERELRRRMGDAAFVYRALRASVAQS